MTVLSDQDIRIHLQEHKQGYRDRAGIDPPPEGRIQPASVDLLLGDEWIVYPETDVYTYIDLDDVDPLTTTIKSPDYAIAPGELVLGTTEESVEIPPELVAVVNGKSSLARLGLQIHITAGFIDPGFRGKITLEIYNLNRMPIILRAGKPICQISFMELSSPAEHPYGHPELNSKYQDQDHVGPSKYEG